MVAPDVSEKALGGRGYLSFFLECIRKLRCEPIVQRFPRGKLVEKLLVYLEESQPNDSLTGVATSLTSKVYSCIAIGDQYKLPSVAQSKIFSAFHKLRTSRDIKEIWSALRIPETLVHESHLALQLIVDRLMKQMIANKVKAEQDRSNPQQLFPLNHREKNAVRYMAGYVAVSLLKRYKRHPKKEKIQT